MADKPKFRVRDNGSAPAVYCNTVIGGFVDGTCVSMTFGATRFIPERTNDAPGNGQHPAAHVTGHVTLTPAAAIELMNMLSNMMAVVTGAAQATGDPKKAN